MKRFQYLAAIFLVVFALDSCSFQSLFTPVAATTSAVGAAVGAGGGYLYASKKDGYDKGKSALVGLGTGAALGLLAGGLMAEEDPAVAAKPKVVRVPVYSENTMQLEIDSLRYEVNESTKWGRGETKPWDERIYENSNFPYQGPAVGTDF